MPQTLLLMSIPVCQHCIPCGFLFAHVNSHASFTFQFNDLKLDKFLVNINSAIVSRRIYVSFEFYAFFQLFFDTKCNRFCILFLSTCVYSYHFVPERKWKEGSECVVPKNCCKCQDGDRKTRLCSRWIAVVYPMPDIISGVANAPPAVVCSLSSLTKYFFVLEWKSITKKKKLGFHSMISIQIKKKKTEWIDKTFW